MIDVADTSRML